MSLRRIPLSIAFLLVLLLGAVQEVEAGLKKFTKAELKKVRLLAWFF